MINNYFVKESAFYCLNERFVSNITRDIIFSTRSSEWRLQTINISQATCRSVRNTELFLEVKITKRKRRTRETLINNYFVKRSAFYHLNERFVSNITGDIIFFDEVFGTPNLGPLHMSPVNRAGSVSKISSRHSFLCKNIDVFI